MSTRSTARILFPPLDNPELTIQRRYHSDPTLLNNSEMVAKGNGDLPVPDLRTTEELCQPSLNGRGGPISPIAIQATNFGLKNDMIQQVHNSCQFHGLPGDDAPKASKLMESPTTSFPPLAILKTYMLQDPIKGANQGQNQPPAYQAPSYQASVHQLQIPQPQVVTTNEFTNFMKANNAILKNMQNNMTSLTNSNLELKNMFGQFMKMNTTSSLGSETLSGNTITNLKEDLNGITTRRGTAYPGPMILTLVVERKTDVTKDTVHPTNNGSTEDVQPPVFPTESPILTSEPVNSPINEPVASPVIAPRPNQRPLFLYPSRLQVQMLRNKANDQREKFFQIFKDLNFNISFVDALILMPKFGPSIKSLLTNKDKLCKLTRTPLNEYCSVVLLKKFPEKLGDPGKFLIPCDFPEMAECLALADLGASFNLMPSRSFLKTRRALIDVFKGNYLPEVRKELKIYEAKSDKSLIDKPPEVELKYLPPHLEYAFLEGDDKLPVIIAKDLSVEEKTALITVLKSHKRAIAWKLSDIKGIDPEFCTHKILMEEDFEPAVQHQRRVNPKIHDVIKQERKQNILVVIEYLSKLVEVKALPINDARVVCKFLKNLFARFGTPQAIISDRGTHFCNDQFAKVMLKYGVTHRLATPYHPQINGQVEVSNCGLKPYKMLIRCTPYMLVYGKACHLPIELEHKAYWALKHANNNLQTTGDHKKVQLNELRDQAYENSVIYKEKTKRVHDSKIKDRVFNIGDRVLFFNSRLKLFSGKLKSYWSGPFTISQVFSYDTAELSQPDGPNFKVNGHRLKHYFGKDVPKMVVPDLQTFPKDH
nr:reverse transcriptase domain-containing protein [Tanacetum cinerariifolium]